MPNKIVALYGFNNYFNRTAKRFETVAEYQENSTNYFEATGVNFTYADGIMTRVIINDSTNYTVDESPDYILVVDQITDDIIGRYYVEHTNINRQGQYDMSVRRDVVADLLDVVKASPIHLERGHVSYGDPLIFNDEDLSLNEIKKSEIMLKDGSNCAWIVGYMARNFPDTDPERVTFYYNGQDYDLSVEYINRWDQYQFMNKSYLTNFHDLRVKVYAELRRSTGTPLRFEFGHDLNTDFYYGATGVTGMPSGVTIQVLNNSKVEERRIELGYTYVTDPDFLKALARDIFQSIETNIDYTVVCNMIANHSVELRAPTITNTKMEALKQYQGKRIYATASQTIYQIDNDNGDGSITGEVKTWDVSLFRDIQTYINSYINAYYFTSYDRSFGFYFALNVFRATMAEVTTATFEIPASTNLSTSRHHLTDAPYDMFAIPFGDRIPIYDANGEEDMRTSKGVAIGMAQAIIEQCGSSVYDVQMLPYCPVQYALRDGVLKDDDPTVIFAKTESDKKVGLIYWGTKSNFTTTISASLEDNDYTNYDDVDWKRDILTKKFRLVSPNYSGIYEFSPYKLAKNYGKENNVVSFSIDCTYKPYNPYIHVTPVPPPYQSYLYGTDFDDSRGLICGGDFSLPMISSAWTEYELANKNYNNIFNRELQTLDLQHKYAGISDVIGGITGAVGAGASGAMTGLFASGGNPVGAAVGAVVGGVTSLAGGIADVAINSELRKDNRDLKVDLYNYQLGNIKAQPYSLTRASAITYNYKYWVFIEVYDASEQEKSIVENMILYHGSKLMKITTIQENLDGVAYREGLPGNYVKGSFIRFVLGEVSTDSHMLNELNLELEKGVFIA